MKNIFLYVFLFSVIAMELKPAIAANKPKPLVINKTLLQKLAPLKTSREIEALLGKPCCCVPVGKSSNEVAICQWKPDIKNSSTFNTLNVTFEVDHIAQIRAITAQGIYVVQDGKVQLEN